RARPRPCRQWPVARPTRSGRQGHGRPLSLNPLGSPIVLDNHDGERPGSGSAGALASYITLTPACRLQVWATTPERASGCPFIHSARCPTCPAMGLGPQSAATQNPSKILGPPTARPLRHDAHGIHPPPSSSLSTACG